MRGRGSDPRVISIQRRRLTTENAEDEVHIFPSEFIYQVFLDSRIRGGDPLLVALSRRRETIISTPLLGRMRTTWRLILAPSKNGSRRRKEGAGREEDGPGRQSERGDLT